MNNWNNQNYEYVINENIKYVYEIVNRLNKENIDSRELIKAGIRGIIAASNDYDVRSKEIFSNFCIEYIIKYVNERKKSLLRNLKYKKWNYGFTFLYVLVIIANNNLERVIKMEKNIFDRALEKNKIRRPVFLNCLKAFISGGCVCLISQLILYFFKDL